MLIKWIGTFPQSLTIMLIEIKCCIINTSPNKTSLYSFTYSWCLFPSKNHFLKEFSVVWNFSLNDTIICLFLHLKMSAPFFFFLFLHTLKYFEVCFYFYLGMFIIWSPWNQCPQTVEYVVSKSLGFFKTTEPQQETRASPGCPTPTPCPLPFHPTHVLERAINFRSKFVIAIKCVGTKKVKSWKVLSTV